MASEGKKELDLQEALSLQSLIAESEPAGSSPRSGPNFVIFLESNNGKNPLRNSSVTCCSLQDLGTHFV